MKPLKDRLVELDFYDNDDDDMDEDQDHWDCDGYLKDKYGSIDRKAFITAKLIRTDLYIGVRVPDDKSSFYTRRYDMFDPKSLSKMYDDLNTFLDKAVDKKPKGHGEWYLLCVDWGNDA